VADLTRSNAIIGVRVLLLRPFFRLTPFLQSTLGQANFYVYFPQLVTASNAGSLIGAIVALISAGGAIGVLINAWVNDRFGRKIGFWSCALLTILGVGLISGATNLTMLCIGRTIQGELLSRVLRPEAYFSRHGRVGRHQLRNGLHQRVGAKRLPRCVFGSCGLRV
jgi:hypothetical protein